MELLIFFALITTLGSAFYLVLCTIYFLFTSRPPGIALNLCWKMMLATLFGFFLFGFGALILPVLWFNSVLEPLPNYSRWRDIFVGFLFSLVGAVVFYFTFIALAWEVLG